MREQKKRLRSGLKKVNKDLKVDYFGIDNSIDEITNLMVPWYHEPDALMRPQIINLWGMTGVGKTSLVRKIAKMLEIDLVEIDLGEYVSRGSSKSFSQDLFKKYYDMAGDKQSIILLDELHTCRTVDEHGNEIDRAGIRGLWSLLSDGMVYLNDRYDDYDFDDVIKEAKQNYLEDKLFIKKNEDNYNRLKKIYGTGKLIENTLSNDDKKLNEQIFGKGANPPSPPNEGRAKAKDEGKEYYEELKWEFEYIKRKDAQAYLGYGVFDVFCKLLNLNKREVNLKTKTDFVGFLDSLKDKIKEIGVQPKLDFKKSLIFVCGNLDDLYMGTKNFDPDINIDAIHQDSLLITISDVKGSLSGRFRAEQLARLGNNHVIYPALSSDAYMQIISDGINVIEEFYLEKERYGISFYFDDSVKSIIYNEGVFPTQGARSALSGVHSFFEPAVVNFIVKYIGLKNKSENKKVKCHFERDKKRFVFSYQTKDAVEKKILIPCYLKIDEFRDPHISDETTLFAVHEAGHIAAGVIYCGQYPRFATIFTMGFGNKGSTNYDDFDSSVEDEEDNSIAKKGNKGSVTSLKGLHDELMLALGGYVAEKVFFGTDNITTGSVSDIKQATRTLVTIYDHFGYNSSPIYKSLSETNSFYIPRGEEDNESMVDNLADVVHKLEREFKLAEIKGYIADLAKALLRSPKLMKEEIEEITIKHNISVPKKFSYLDCFSTELETLERLGDSIEPPLKK